MNELWRWSNLGLAFGLEIAGLGIFAWWGWRTGDSLALRLVLAIGLPLIAAVVWGLFAAPTANYGSPVVTTIVKVAFFGLAGLALWSLDHRVVAATSSSPSPRTSSSSGPATSTPSPAGGVQQDQPLTACRSTGTVTGAAVACTTSSTVTPGASSTSSKESAATSSTARSVMTRWTTRRPVSGQGAGVDEFGIAGAGAVFHQHDHPARATDQVHRAAHAFDHGAGDHPVREVAVPRDLHAAQDRDVDMTAADHRETGRGIEVRRSRDDRDRLLARRRSGPGRRPRRTERARRRGCRSRPAG